MSCPNTMNLFLLLFFFFGGIGSVNGQEGCANVLDATATLTRSGRLSGTWEIAVTVSSEEYDWDKYCNEWKLENPADGSLVAKRLVMHPHTKEQPFTRSWTGVEMPDDISVLIVSAQDSVLGYCGETFELVLREEPRGPVAANETDSKETIPTIKGTTIHIIAEGELVINEKQDTTASMKKDQSEEMSEAEALDESASLRRTYWLAALLCGFVWML